MSLFSEITEESFKDAREKLLHIADLPNILREIAKDQEICAKDDRTSFKQGIAEQMEYKATCLRKWATEVERWCKDSTYILKMMGERIKNKKGQLI